MDAIWSQLITILTTLRAMDSSSSDFARAVAFLRLLETNPKSNARKASMANKTKITPLALKDELHLAQTP
jgi:hypothetical protein